MLRHWMTNPSPPGINTTSTLKLRLGFDKQPRERQPPLRSSTAIKSASHGIPRSSSRRTRARREGEYATLGLSLQRVRLAEDCVLLSYIFSWLYYVNKLIRSMYKAKPGIREDPPKRLGRLERDAAPGTAPHALQLELARRRSAKTQT